MKKLLLLLPLLACSVVIHAEDSHARLFAFDLKTEVLDEVFYATFQTNTPFTSGRLLIYDPMVDIVSQTDMPVITKEFTPTSPDVVINGSLVMVPIPEQEMTGDKEILLDVLNWAVELTGTPIEEGSTLVEFSDPTDENITFYCPQGIVINTNPYSAHFANVYIAQSAKGRVTDDTDESDDWYNAAKYNRTKKQQKGIFVYDPLFREKNPSNKGYLPNNLVFQDAWRHDLHRLAINPTNDHIAIAYWSRHTGKSETSIYEIDPDELCGDIHNFVAKDVAPASGLVRAHSMCYDQAGCLYVLDSANVNSTGTSASGKLYSNVSGSWEVLVDGPTQGNVSPLDGTSPLGLWSSLDNMLASDGQGGVWVAQYREDFLKDVIGSNGKRQMDLYPILTHVNASGAVDFMVSQKSASDTIDMFRYHPTDGKLAAGRGQLAYYEKENLLAFAGGRKVTLYRAVYHATGPVLTKWLSTPEIADDIDGIAFDYVGNLYVLSHTTQRMYAFALPIADNTSYVPAPRKVITVSQEADNTNSVAINFYKSLPANSVVDVKLLRPFINEYWQTLTLPFAMNAEQIGAIYGDGSKIAILQSSYLKSQEWLYLKFDFIDSVPVGKPCLVAPSMNVSRGGVVHRVTLSTDLHPVNTDYAAMYGIIAPIDFNEFDANNEGYYYFLAPNQLLANNAATTMLALRAYFKLALSPEQMRNLRARVVFDENTATELDDTIYDSSVQAQKILENGQLIIIRNGMRYDLQGKPL